MGLPQGRRLLVRLPVSLQAGRYDFGGAMCFRCQQSCALLHVHPHSCAALHVSLHSCCNPSRVNLGGSSVHECVPDITLWEAATVLSLSLFADQSTLDGAV